jgi:hypothetical protein
MLPEPTTLPKLTTLPQPTNELVPSKLKPAFNRRLAAYAAAATGTAALALTTTAHAEIVYTPANVTTGSSTPLDLNHDGINDFTWESVPYDSGHGHDFGPALDVPGNAVWGVRTPLPIGTPIGSKGKFASSTYYGVVFMGEDFEYGTITNTFGFWKNVTNKFMGFKFMVGGEVHYGWARLSWNGPVSVIISGYAYETVANKPIRAGQRTESEAESASVSSVDSSAEGGASLGLLASGANGIGVWRRGN